MDSQRWQQVKLIFQAALDLPLAERPGYVQAASAGDEELRREVDSLLESDAGSTHFLGEVAADYVPGLALEEELPDANLGRRIGPYHIVHEIGSGGMGSVYLAERVDEFRQKAALKLMRPGMDSRMVVSRFRHERQILAGLDHPNIARLLDGGATDDGRPYFVMEYVEGTPIGTYCHSYALTVAHRLKLFRQVCAAVQYAHQNLVVHRDLKPGNILVTGDGIPKLLDFGIAKLLRPGAPGETEGLTQVGVRLMTPEYASPEQVRGLPIATAMDVYSLGVVLYELLTGRMPYEFATRSPVEIERVICQQEPAPPSTLEGGVHRHLAGDLDTIVLKALEKDPQRRYGSVEQLSEDIRRHLEGEPILARPSTLMYRASRFARRNRTAVGAAIVVLLSLAAGLVAMARGTFIARRERARAELRFNDVRHLAESFLFEFDDKIKDLAGATPARTLVVERALQYLRSLTQEAAGDASLARELAEAYLKVGDLQGNPYESNLGDTAGALASYQQALSIAENAVRRDASDLAARQYLARAHRSIGEVLPLRDDAAGAVPHFRQAIALLEAVPAVASRSVPVRSELSKNYEMLADVLGRSGITNLGDARGARAAYEKALTLNEALMSGQPASVPFRRATAVLDMKLGDILVETNEREAGIRRYRTALAIFEALSSAAPDNAVARSSVAMMDRKLGETFEAGGETPAALEQYLKASEVSRHLMLADPTNARARMGYIVDLKSRADLLNKTGDPPGALALYREILDLLRPLYTAEPGNIMLRVRYSTMLVYIGDLLARLHHQDEARKLYGQGLGIAKDLADRPGATPGEISGYAEYLIDCPGDLPDLHNPPAAVAYARRAVEITKGETPEYLEILARAYFAAGDAGNAVAIENQALALIPPSPARTAAGNRLARFQAAQKSR